MAANPNPTGPDTVVLDQHTQTVTQLGALLIAEMRRSDELRNAEMHRLDELRTAEANRIDMLRLAERERIDLIVHMRKEHVDEVNAAETKRVDQMMILRADFGQQLREAEAKRIDAIRAVDVAAVAVGREEARQQASVLANQVSSSADTLRTLVATTASAAAEQLRALAQSFTDRLAALEKAQYEARGSTEGSPLVTRLAALEAQRSGSEGSGKGMRDMWGFVIAALVVLVAIGGLIINAVGQ